MIAIVHGTIERVQEVREVKKTSVLNFTVKEMVRRGDKEFPMYIRCAAWGKLCDSLSGQIGDGQYVIVQGEPGASAYMKDGEAKASLEINAREVSFVQGDAPKQSSSGRRSRNDDDDSDCPF